MVKCPGLRCIILYFFDNFYFLILEIGEAFVPFFQLDTKQFVANKIGGYDVNNGQYLIRVGTFKLGDGGKDFHYMQTYEKKADGKYLIIHDEFEWE